MIYSNIQAIEVFCTNNSGNFLVFPFASQRRASVRRGLAIMVNRKFWPRREFTSRIRGRSLREISETTYLTAHHIVIHCRSRFPDRGRAGVFLLIQPFGSGAW
jgi:hypothetical protein